MVTNTARLHWWKLDSRRAKHQNIYCGKNTKYLLWQQNQNIYCGKKSKYLLGRKIKIFIGAKVKNNQTDNNKIDKWIYIYIYSEVINWVYKWIYRWTADYNNTKKQSTKYYMNDCINDLISEFSNIIGLQKQACVKT